MGWIGLPWTVCVPSAVWVLRTHLVVYLHSNPCLLPTLVLTLPATPLPRLVEESKLPVLGLLCVGCHYARGQFSLMPQDSQKLTKPRILDGHLQEENLSCRKFRIRLNEKQLLHLGTPDRKEPYVSQVSEEAKEAI